MNQAEQWKADQARYDEMTLGSPQWWAAIRQQSRNFWAKVQA